MLKAQKNLENIALLMKGMSGLIQDISVSLKEEIIDDDLSDDLDDLDLDDSEEEEDDSDDLDLAEQELHEKEENFQEF